MGAVTITNLDTGKTEILGDEYQVERARRQRRGYTVLVDDPYEYEEERND